MRILGIDPGTGICGFGVIEVTANIHADHQQKGAAVNTLYRGRPQMLDCGVISTPPHTPLGDRLLDIYDSLHEIIDSTHPDCLSVEKLFFSQNVTTGISVAEARGIVLLVARQYGLMVYEYTPNQIKKALTGYGHAEKKQIQEMVKQHLGLTFTPQPDDAADALAAAITHTLIQHME